MRFPVVLRQAAKSEFDEAYDWYEQKKPGLGDEFAACIREVLERITVMPLIHGIVHRDIRKAVVKQFPYCVYYRARKDAVVVVSVFHTRRNPRTWQKRS